MASLCNAMPSRGSYLLLTIFGLYLLVLYATRQFISIIVDRSSSDRLSVFYGIIAIRRLVL